MSAAQPSPAVPAGRVLVLGATGYTGELTAAALVDRGVRPVLAGRDATRLDALAARLGGLPTAVADVRDEASLRALIRPGDVLVTTVGPFARLGMPAARVAAQVGAHYLDSTGEVGFVRDLKAQVDPLARRSGATMLSAFGFDYVPGLLAGALALQEAGRSARAVHVCYLTTGDSDAQGISRGTRATLREAMTSPVLGFEDGRLCTLTPGSRTQQFTVGGRRHRGVLLGGTEVLFLPRTDERVKQVRVFNGMFPARPTQAGLLAVNLLGSVPGAAALARRLRGGGEDTADATRNVTSGEATAGTTSDAREAAPVSLGPDAARRARTGTAVVAVVRDGSGRPLSEVHLEGPNAYTLTADLLAWGAQTLAGTTAAASTASATADATSTAAAPTPAGVRSPLEVFGLQGLEQGCAALGLRLH